MTSNRRMSTQKMVMGAVLTAIVIVLQLFASTIRFGMFNITLILIPVVIGAATCGKGISTWLGFVFGAVVLLSGQAASFLVLSVPGTIITVLAKGALCGFAAGLAYELIAHKNRYMAVLVSAIVCPIVNTAVFTAGCYIFFFEGLKSWLAAPDFAGFGNVTQLVFFGLIGGNFFVELGLNIVLNPVAVKILDIADKVKKN